MPPLDRARRHVSPASAFDAPSTAAGTVGRRRFLEALAGFGVAARSGFAPFVGGCAEDALPAARLDDLERRLPGRVLRPGAPDYAAYTAPWNLHWSGRRPVASVVVRATSAADVATAVRWATETGTPLVARSGGHSYAGYSTTGGVAIDVSSMTSVAFDASTGLATLGGGARNRHVYDELRKVGRTVTHGRCYGVGVAGLVLGGGIGFNMRRLGLTCDQLRATELVLPSGEIVRASDGEDPELFWGVRGAGGGNFGVHTSFVFQTHPADDLVIFQRGYEARVPEVFAKLLEAARGAPRELGLKFNVRAQRDAEGKSRIKLVLLGQWAGREDDLRAFLAPLEAISPPDAASFLERVPYWVGQDRLSDEGKPEHMMERSRYVHGDLGAAAIELVMSRLAAWPGTSGQTSFKGFLTGGAISDVAPDATSFVHRKDWLLSTIDMGWSASDDPAAVLAALEWLDAFHDALAPFTSAEAYQNFVDDGLADPLRAYHGANLPRLVALKLRIDPNGVLTFPQAIPTSLGG